MSALTLLAFQNATLLRAFRTETRNGGQVIHALKDLGDMLERDPSNVRKSLNAVAEDGLLIIDNPNPVAGRLTAAGEAALAALEQAEDGYLGGSSALPDGFVAVRHDQIGQDPDNARKTSGLSPEAIQDMADSLVDKGMLQQPELRKNPDYPAWEPEYLLTMGERRWRGWGLNIERGDWPADKLIVCKLENRGEVERLEAGLVENLQRADISNLEMAEGFLILHERHGRTSQDIAKTVGKTSRFVQIAIKVAREASAEDKARYVESERAYAEGKAQNIPGTKRLFTWETLRDTVKTARYVTMLEKRSRLTLMVAELAMKVDADPDAVEVYEVGYDGVTAKASLISTPPGGGHWGEAQDLGVAVDYREDGKIYGGVTAVAREWLKDAGFDKDPRAWTKALAVEVLTPMPVKLAEEAGIWNTQFLNPPKPAPAPPPPPAPAEPTPPARDSFAEAIRQVNEPPEDQVSLHKPAAMGLTENLTDQPAIQAAIGGASSPEPVRDESQLSPDLFVALVETGHKITHHGIDTRGGVLRGCRVGNYFSGPDAKLASALIQKRYIAFVQAPSGNELLASLTQAGWDYIDGSIDDAVLELHQFENLGQDTLNSLHASGRKYLTDWLQDPVKVERVTPTAAPAPTQAFEAPAGEAFGGGGELGASFDDDFNEIDQVGVGATLSRDEVDGYIRQCAAYLLVFARPEDAIHSHAAFGTAMEAEEVAEILKASGQYDTVDIYDGGPGGALLSTWSAQ
ncbi:ParB/RepB/Spo0J family partition protein [Caulobacter sp. RL271]|uniref:ParB N-terminal domain-containing protein n=1 Tax=Caulobacter segnis TaxID=88688 RepID=A0ABY4ZZC9_9CAUL|nr:ParB N-terminal domain-containing protein [Caulobacter segnis]USQ97281.1 ParB N-terminal domain-containing protein [Caulobacter segnis]